MKVTQRPDEMLSAERFLLHLDRRTWAAADAGRRELLERELAVALRAGMQVCLS